MKYKYIVLTLLLTNYLNLHAKNVDHVKTEQPPKKESTANGSNTSEKADCSKIPLSESRQRNHKRRKA